MTKKVEFKTNEEYSELYKFNEELIQEILDRIEIGQTIKIIHRNMEGLILDIEGDIETQRNLGFSFEFEYTTSFVYIDLATEELSFSVVETDGYKLFKKWKDEKEKISYVEWLENKILKEL